MEKILVFFPTYNEVGNVEALIGAIRTHLPGAHILAVDDASPDGTGQLLNALAGRYRGIEVILRPRKMGVGTAHKLAMLYARQNGFEVLVTMDADFSHHPKYLPVFLDRLSRADFVTGSRYIEGGTCNYGFYRTFISRTANLVAQAALGLPLKENTTLYRGYVLPLLEHLNIDEIKSEGYSFAVESLFRISRVANGLEEFPIRFENRLVGQSKISKVEIYKAVLTIISLAAGRVRARHAPTVADVNDTTEQPAKCCNCQGTYHIEVYPPRDPLPSSESVSAYTCSSRAVRSHGQILRCLQCGLTFMRPRFSGDQLLEEYDKAEDPTYLENIAVRERMFEYNLAAVAQYTRPGCRLLDIGSHGGAFLNVAKEHGLEVMGLEPCSWAVAESRKRVDAPVIHGTTQNLPDDIGNFDIVTMWDVLEHLSDPLEELRRVHRLLRPDGTLLFSTLMIDNWFAKLSGSRWPWLMDMHLFYFTDATISHVLQQTGFAIMESRNYCHMVTTEYLLSKLGTLGLPGTEPASAFLKKLKWNNTVLPFRLGDIKLFVCKKRAG